MVAPGAWPKPLLPLLALDPLIIAYWQTLALHAPPQYRTLQLPQ
jgi:hypothetical protein